LRSKNSLSGYWRDIIHQASGNSAAQAIGVLGIPVLARIYEPADFAVQSIFLQVVTFLAGIITWRYEYFFQLLSGDAQARKLFVWIVKLGGGAALIMTVVLLFYGVDISIYFGDSAIGQYLVFAPLTAFLMSIGLGLQHDVQRCRQFKVSALSEVVGKASYVMSGIVLAPFGVIGLIATNVFSALGKVSVLRKHLLAVLFKDRGDSHPDEAHPRTLHAKGAGAMVLSHVFLTIGSATPILFISHQYGIETLGQFSIVMSTIFLPSGLVGLAIGQVFYQRAAEYFRESKDISLLWWSTVKRLIIFGLPIYMVAILCSSFIYPLVLGGQWREAGSYAQIFSVAAFFSFISTPLDRTSLILRKNAYLPIMHFVRMLCSISVVAVAVFSNANFLTYLILMTIQMSALYFADMMCGYFFVRSATRQAESGNVVLKGGRASLPNESGRK